MLKKSAKNLATLTLIAPLLLATGAAAPAETIYFASSVDHAPYSSLDHSGRVQGFEAELKDLICTRAQLICDWVPTPENELVPQLLAQEYDVIMSDFQITDLRKSEVSFSIPYLNDMPTAVLVLTTGALPGPGGRVGIVNGSLQGRVVSANGWSPVTFQRAREALKALENGEIRGFAADQAYAQNLVARHPETYKTATSGIETPGGIALGVRASAAGLLARLNAAIQSLKSDGTLAALKAKWVTSDDGQ